jgi:dTDP-N-acetylfucosamine:lipid II N-acetylfucosaminyltransferase
MPKILHLAIQGPITCDFFLFLEQGFDCGPHLLLSRDDGSKWPTLNRIQIINAEEKRKWLTSLLDNANKADKIILHGLFDPWVVLFFTFNPWLLKKCYWIIWGGDLYRFQRSKMNAMDRVYEAARKTVIQNIGHLVTYIPGDVNLARQWYGAKGVYHDCIVYPSNTVDDIMTIGKSVENSQAKTINILLGNSADPSNNHIGALEKLLPYKDKDLKIYAPLSYGNQENAKLVIKTAKEWFGDSFIPLTSFMPLAEYLSFLKCIDVAIFNHNRQQGMGNTITLLALGVKVFMRSDVAQWRFFNDLNIGIYDINEISIDAMLSSAPSDNIEIVQERFSKIQLHTQLSLIFA